MVLIKKKEKSVLYCRCVDLIGFDIPTQVLANRPGFPFLGNDFFASLGDLFAAHAIDNPDVASEMQLLRNYGRQLPEEILKKLVKAFGELRGLADKGQIAYPYSTREVVAIVKHLDQYPHEGNGEATCICDVDATI